MSERDPRIDPRPGDRLRKNGGKVREVTSHVVAGAIFYNTIASTGATHGKVMTLDAWRSWAKYAEVLPPAADQAGRRREG